MTSKFPWFRLYASDMRHERKIARIAKRTGIDRATIVGVWVTILCLASDSPKRGWLLMDGGSPLEYEEIVEEVGLDVMKFDAILRQFLSESFDMLAIDNETSAYFVTQWEERQPMSDTTGAERVRKHRERVKLQAKEVKRYSNALEEDTDTDKEKDIDKDKEAIGDAFAFFENNFQLITVYTSEKLGNLIDEYTVQWVREAMQIAVDNNKRSLSYVEGILKRWKAQGKNVPRKEKIEVPAAEF